MTSWSTQNNNMQFITIILLVIWFHKEHFRGNVSKVTSMDICGILKCSTLCHINCNVVVTCQSSVPKASMYFSYMYNFLAYQLLKQYKIYVWNHTVTPARALVIYYDLQWLCTSGNTWQWSLRIICVANAPVTLELRLRYDRSD